MGQINRWCGMEKPVLCCKILAKRGRERHRKLFVEELIRWATNNICSTNFINNIIDDLSTLSCISSPWFIITIMYFLLWLMITMYLFLWLIIIIMYSNSMIHHHYHIFHSHDSLSCISSPWLINIFMYFIPMTHHNCHVFHHHDWSTLSFISSPCLVNIIMYFIPMTHQHYHVFHPYDSSALSGISSPWLINIIMYFILTTGLQTFWQFLSKGAALLTSK